MDTRVEELPLADILELRLDVLRRGTPSSSPSYAEDSDPAARHLGVRSNGEVVACSTWIRRDFPPSPEFPAMQLKGMAVANHLQGTGLGQLVLRAGIELARSENCELVWARARDSALGFYEGNGMSVVGEQFIDETTTLPHHLVVIRLTS